MGRIKWSDFFEGVVRVKDGELLPEPPPRPLSHSVMSLNATSASSSIFHKYSAQELYAGTDFASLSWVERQWANWYLLIGDPVIATGLASFLLHEVCRRLVSAVVPPVDV